MLAVQIHCLEMARRSLLSREWSRFSLIPSSIGCGCCFWPSELLTSVGGWGFNTCLGSKLSPLIRGNDFRVVVRVDGEEGGGGLWIIQFAPPSCRKLHYLYFRMSHSYD